MILGGWRNKRKMECAKNEKGAGEVAWWGGCWSEACVGSAGTLDGGVPCCWSWKETPTSCLDPGGVSFLSISDSHWLNLTKISGKRIWEIQRAGILAWQYRVGDGGESAGLWADTTTAPPLWNSYHIEVLRPAALICYDCWVVIKYKHHFKDEYWPSQLRNGEEFAGKLFLWFLTCSLAGDRGVDKQVQRGKKVRFQCFRH